MEKFNNENKINLLFILNLALKTIEENIRLQEENKVLRDNLNAMILIDELNS